jgi:hypothetical protein
MEGSSSRIGTVVVALVVGATIGYFIGKGTTPKPTDRCHTIANHTVIVDLAGNLDCVEVEIGQGNTVSWQAPAGTKVAVTFQGSSVFGNSTCRDTSNTCTSGFPTVVWGNGETKRYVDYDLTLKGGTQPSPTRGRIIIDK